MWLFVYCGTIYTNNNKTNNPPYQTTTIKMPNNCCQGGWPTGFAPHPITHPFKSKARMRMCCNTSSEVIWGSTAKERNSSGKKLSHFCGEKTWGRPSGVTSHTDMDDMAEGKGRDVAGARSRQGFWAMERTGTHKISSP